MEILFVYCCFPPTFALFLYFNMQARIHCIFINNSNLYLLKICLLVLWYLPLVMLLMLQQASPLHQITFPCLYAAFTQNLNFVFLFIPGMFTLSIVWAYFFAIDNFYLSQCIHIRFYTVLKYSRVQGNISFMVTEIALYSTEARKSNYVFYFNWSKKM